MSASRLFTLAWKPDGFSSMTMQPAASCTSAAAAAQLAQSGAHPYMLGRAGPARLVHRRSKAPPCAAPLGGSRTRKCVCQSRSAQVQHQARLRSLRSCHPTPALAENLVQLERLRSRVMRDGPGVQGNSEVRTRTAFERLGSV